jgi:hypothetical protein
MKDRGQIAFGCTDRQIESEWTVNNPETRANQFASDLLLPPKLFGPLAKGRPITLETVRDLGGDFQMSLTATAIKLVRSGSFSAMLVYYENGKRKWFIPSSDDFPKKLWPAQEPTKGTVTARLIAGERIPDKGNDVCSDKWFEVRDAERYYIRESCFRNGPGSVVTILWWDDEAQIIDLEEEEERNAARRSDWRPLD